MKHNPAETLIHEHEVIKKTGDAVKGMNALWKSDALAYRKKVKDVLEFLKIYSDGYHHHKEEEVLFPAMSEHPDFHLQGILDELNEHHENFREYVLDIEVHLAASEYEALQKSLERYMEQLQDHIAIENDELFIMAENLFDEKQLEEIYFRFADIDRELGEERKKELEGFASSL